MWGFPDTDGHAILVTRPYYIEMSSVPRHSGEKDAYRGIVDTNVGLAGPRTQAFLVKCRDLIWKDTRENRPLRGFLVAVPVV